MTLIIDKLLYHVPNENSIENDTSVLICNYKWRVIFYIVTHTDTDSKWQKNLQKGSLKNNLTPRKSKIVNIKNWNCNFDTRLTQLSYHINN